MRSHPLSLDCQFFLRIATLIALLLSTNAAVAGGPRYVAGVSYFNSGTKGTPLTWANGTIQYYTDPGDLSPILPHASADSFVANAFVLWTSIPTAAVSATEAGNLAEDVSGSNVFMNSDARFPCLQTFRLLQQELRWELSMTKMDR